MPYLKKLTIKGNEYYYMFHTVRDGRKFKKLSRYIGKELPPLEEFKAIQADLIEEAKEALQETKEKACESSTHSNSERINVVSLLQDIQKEFGYLPKEEMLRVAKELEIPAVDIFGVATFYSQFKLSSQGTHTINLCRGTACHVKGSGRLLSFLEEHLGIKAGQTTADGKISLNCVNCIGACAKAPAMLLDNVTYGNLDEEKLKKIIDGLKKD